MLCLISDLYAHLSYAARVKLMTPRNIVRAFFLRRQDNTMQTIRYAFAAPAESLDSVFWNWLATGGVDRRISKVAEGLLEKHSHDLGEIVRMRLDLLKSFGDMYEYVRFDDKSRVSDVLASFDVSEDAGDAEDAVDVEYAGDAEDVEDGSDTDVKEESTSETMAIPRPSLPMLPMVPEPTDEVASNRDEDSEEELRIVTISPSSQRDPDGADD